MESKTLENRNRNLHQIFTVKTQYEIHMTMRVKEALECWGWRSSKCWNWSGKWDHTSDLHTCTHCVPHIYNTYNINTITPKHIWCTYISWHSVSNTQDILTHNTSNLFLVDKTRYYTYIKSIVHVLVEENAMSSHEGFPRIGCPQVAPASTRPCPACKIKSRKVTESMCVKCL